MIFFVLGMGFGYSTGLGQEVERVEKAATRSQPVRVLGVETIPHYVNPFKTVDAAEVLFPIAQLKGCRNLPECHTYCSQPENFQPCVAWSKAP